MWYRLITLVFAIAFSGSVALASAPKVALHLDAQLVEKVNGHVALTAVGDRRLKAGDLVIYRITAHNGGSAPALALAPGGKIPPHTVFVRVVSAPAGAKPSFSLDGNAFSEHPTITVVDKDGHKVTKPAPLDAYRAIRWTMSAPLRPSASAAFAYEVRVQ